MASKEKYWESSVDKQMLISVVGTNVAIDNSMLESGTFSLEESLCSESELKFGCCEANSVKFTAHNTAGSLVGRTISISETLDGDTENPTKYGVYKVYSDIPTADRTKRQITAYDAMYDIINADVKAWYAGLNFPMTLKAFRDSFFAYLGIEQKDATLVNDGITVNKTLVAVQTDDSSAATEESSISGKTVVTAICEINGAFGNINRDGEFEYVILPSITSAIYPAEDLFPRNDLFPADANTESMSGYYITFDYEDFKSKAITQLEIRPNDSSAGAIVGTSGNNYVISGNFLVSDKTSAELEQIANNVFPIMKQAAYTPLKTCTCVGNPCLELGDPIRFNTTREIVETYILQRTLTGEQSKRDSISAQGTETHSAKVNSMRETLESVQRRTSKLERNADHLLSQYEDLDKQTNTRFEQTSDSILQEAVARINADNDTRASLELKIDRDDNDQIVSMINASADIINLKGNRLVVESDNFMLDADGNAEFSGDINGAKGTFTKGFAVELPEADYGALVAQFLIKTTSDGMFIGLKSNDGTHGLRIKGGKVYISGIGTSPNDDNDHLVYVNGSKAVSFKDLNDYATKSYVTSSTSDYITGIEVNASGQSGTSGYTKNYFLRVSNSGTYTSFGASQLYMSDRRAKRDITEAQDISHAYMRLVPVHFRYKEDVDGVDGHWHYGFIAQDVKQAFTDAKIDSENEALVGHDVEDDVWLLDKDELHAMHVQMIQKQQREIEFLKQENKEIKDKLSALERRASHAEDL